MTNEKLKPCPFCGGEAKLEASSAFPTYYVRCDCCGVSTLANRQDQVVDEWNTRADDAEIDKLREVIKRFGEQFLRDAALTSPPEPPGPSDQQTKPKP